MSLDKYDILATLPKKTYEGGGHLNCKDCGFQSCVVFAMKVAIGKTKLSKCPHLNRDSLDKTLQRVATIVGIGYRQLLREDSNGDDQEEQPSPQVPSISTGLIISNDNLFIEKLNLLKEFSGQISKNIYLPTVAIDGGLFGWFDHTVTGDELNHLTENLQDKMIEQNKIAIKLVKEIATIYDTFTALDKVYVQEIVIAINTAFEAIGEVRVTNEKISNQQNEISGAQEDIKQVINQQKQIIQVLKNFKEKLENLKHLDDIDEMYNEVQAFDKQYEEVQNELTALREEKATLFKSFALYKGISIASATFSLTLLILFCTGVLR